MLRSAGAIGAGRPILAAPPVRPDFRSIPFDFQAGQRVIWNRFKIRDVDTAIIRVVNPASPDRKEKRLPNSPEEAVFRSCYASVDLESMLETAEKRGQIRKLPPAQLYFAVKQMAGESLERLLPHITEEQWSLILDLDVWSKDRLQIGPFLFWARLLLKAEKAVAQKLFRGTDADMWELAFRRDLKIFARTEEDEFEGETASGREWMHSPDQNFLIFLPRNPEKAKLYRALLRQMQALYPERFSLLLSESLVRTPMELEESAYQERVRRIESLGFQDYFEAVELYGYRKQESFLPDKKWDSPEQVQTLPEALRSNQDSGMLLLRALASVEDEREVGFLLEELFYVCNKLLAADRVSPARPERLKSKIRKALSTINLGLDFWSGSNYSRARQGVRKHYLAAYFQIGHSRLMDIQREAHGRLKDGSPELGSLAEAFVEGLRRPFPVLAFLEEDRIKRRFFETLEDLQAARNFLRNIELTRPPAPAALRGDDRR